MDYIKTQTEMMKKMDIENRTGNKTEILVGRHGRDFLVSYDRVAVYMIPEGRFFVNFHPNFSFDEQLNEEMDAKIATEQYITVMDGISCAKFIMENGKNVWVSTKIYRNFGVNLYQKIGKNSNLFIYDKRSEKLLGFICSQKLRGENG